MNDTGRTMRRELSRSSDLLRASVALVTAMASLPAWAAAPAAKSDSVVVVDVDASLERADQLRERITTDAEKVLREHDVATTIDPAAPRTLTIGVGGERYDYQVELVVERAGKVDEPVKFRCECNYDELFAKVSEGVLERVPALQQTSESTPPSTPPTHEPPVDPPDAPLDATEPAPLGGLGKGGIAALVVGAAGLATGIAFVVVGKQTDEGDESVPEGEASGTDFRPAGYAMLAVGGAALITGAVLLGVDRARARKRATALAPWFGPRSAGLTFTTRF
jgi:hypothetical protein